MKGGLQTYFVSDEVLTSRLVNTINTLINAAYLKGEAGMWKNDLPRTYPEEVVARIGENQLIVAELDGAIIGSVCVNPVNNNSTAAMFGMLAVDERHTNQGVGNRLIAAAERWAVDNGMKEMQLELLSPTTWEHPAKVVLKQWYARLGYHPKETRSFAALYPEPATFLTTDCDFTLWTKELEHHPR